LLSNGAKTCIFNPDGVFGIHTLHWNGKDAAAWTFPSMVEANDNVLRYFQDIYNEHRCSAQCGPVATIDPHKSGDVWGMIRE